MAGIEDFKYVLTLWKERELPEVIERKIKLDLNADKIITIAGVRRAGKTHLMFHHIKKLLAEGIKKDSIVYIDFENERLFNAKVTELDNLLIAHTQLFNPQGMIYLFLDEIQNVDDWDKWVRKVYETKKYRIIITGSSSKLLSAEIATALAGRNLLYIVYPFSFEEFIKAKKMRVDKTQKYSVKKGLVLRALDDFLEYGAFPEVALADNQERKMEILSSYFDAIFFRDIVKRYNVRRIGELNLFLKIIVGNYASYFSSVKSHNYFKTMGLKTSRVTILNFLNYSKSVFLVETLEQPLKSARKRLASQTKTYVIDIGISKLFTDIDKGRSLENSVFLELLRRKKTTDEIKYLKLKSGKEIDFFLTGAKKELIQVAYDVSKPETKERETSAIIEAAETFGLKEATIITYDYENTESKNGVKINYAPFWLWALE